jgi:hypothetical protein
MENLSVSYYTASESSQSASLWEDLSPISHDSDLTLEEIILWAKGATINDIFHPKINVSKLFETQIFSDEQPYLNIAYVLDFGQQNLYFSKADLKSAQNEVGTWKIKDSFVRLLW